MTIRSVFLHAGSETLSPGRGPAAYAVGLSHAFNAHLEALILELDMTTPKSGHGREILQEALAQIQVQNADALNAANSVREAAEKMGVEAEVTTERSHIHSTPEIAADHARLADLVVAGVCNQGLLSERQIAESLVFQSGRPVIVVPDDHETEYSAARVVVAWDFSRVAARAISDALPILRSASEVRLVTFGDDKSFASSVTMDQVLSALRRRGVEAQFDQLNRGSLTIGEAINSAVKNANADLLVMGGFGHSRFRDFILGGATRSVLTAPIVPTLLSH